MALPASLTLAQFSDKLRVTKASLHCPSPMQVSRTGGGEVLRARLGASLWQGEATLAFQSQRSTGGIRALIDMLLDENTTFGISPADYYGPASDLGGAILGASAVTLSAVAANNRDLTLAGLPAGYVMSPDDLLSFPYAGKVAFHRVLVGGTASSGGTVTLDVWPRVRPGWSAGAVVQLRNPYFRAVMTERDPGASERIFHSGMSFSFIQTLR